MNITITAHFYKFLPRRPPLIFSQNPYGFHWQSYNDSPYRESAGRMTPSFGSFLLTFPVQIHGLINPDPIFPPVPEFPNFHFRSFQLSRIRHFCIIFLPIPVRLPSIKRHANNFFDGKIPKLRLTASFRRPIPVTLALKRSTSAEPPGFPCG